MIESTMTWGGAVMLFLLIVTFSFIMACIDAGRDQKKREKEREENRKWQLR